MKEEYDSLLYRENQIEQEVELSKEKRCIIYEQMQFIEAQIDVLVMDYEAVTGTGEYVI